MSDDDRSSIGELSVVPPPEPESDPTRPESSLFSPTNEKTETVGDGELSNWDEKELGPKPVIKATDMPGDRILLACMTAAKAIQKGKAEKKVR